MKKIYLTLVLGALTLGINAQQNKINTKAISGTDVNITEDIAASIATATTTTIRPPSYAASNCTLTLSYATGSITTIGGYIAGNNKYGDMEKAMKYSLNTNSLALPGTISQVLLYIGSKKAGGPGTGVLSVKVYADNASVPGTLLGTSSTKPISTLTTQSYTNNAFTFTTPVALTTDVFFVSVDFSNANLDTLSLVSTKSGATCVSTSSLSAWEMDQNGAWEKIATNWGGLTIDLGIFPVITSEKSVGINDLLGTNISLLQSFPNPASNELSINFGLNQPSKVEIEIYDVTGKMVSISKLTKLDAGNHNTTLDVSNLNSGLYFYSIKSENTKLFRKFMVAK